MPRQEYFFSDWRPEYPKIGNYIPLTSSNRFDSILNEFAMPENMGFDIKIIQIAVVEAEKCDIMYILPHRGIFAKLGVDEIHLCPAPLAWVLQTIWAHACDQ